MQIATLPDGRLHLNHGPIDLVIGFAGEPAAVAAARDQATIRFRGLLEELVAELPLLRRPVGGRRVPKADGPVARRMVAAVWPHRATFITPMAAVAGAVADEVLAAALRGLELTRAYVNNGGDIAFHLAPGEVFRIGLVAAPERPPPTGLAAIPAEAGWRGVATSGAGGRSFSLGIADSVTVVAKDAAAADAAATLIANAVDLDHPAVCRAPACSLDPDSDLGARAVTLSLGPLDAADRRKALDAGSVVAERMLAAGLIGGAVLVCQGDQRPVGGAPRPCRAELGAGPPDRR